MQHRICRMTDTWMIMASNGTEAGAPPRWIIVDGEDCAVDGVPLLAGDGIGDALRRMAAAGLIPAGAQIARRESLDDYPYPWQPDGLTSRWHVSAPGRSAGAA
jgi:hypothetical protein